MLVYLKEPMGYTQLDEYRVYGRRFAYGSFGSVDLPIDLYKKHRDILEDARYTKKWLENKFDKEFPNMSFTIGDLYRMDFKSMVKLAKLVGVKYVGSGKKTPTTKERHALRKSIITFLNS
jgi:hypothetical protein